MTDAEIEKTITRYRNQERAHAIAAIIFGVLSVIATFQFFYIDDSVKNLGAMFTFGLIYRHEVSMSNNYELKHMLLECTNDTETPTKGE